MNIGQKIKMFRERLGYTQRQLGLMIHVSESAIGNYETGKRSPSVELLKQVADALQVQVNEFFEEEKKSLLQLPYTYIEFRKWMQTHEANGSWPWLTEDDFEFILKSDRYFVQLDRRYLVWLKDGFFFVPIQSEFIDSEYSDFVKIEEIRKVLRRDIDAVSKEVGRVINATYDVHLFAEQVYRSKYDFFRPQPKGNSCFFDDDAKWLAFDVNHILAYIGKNHMFYFQGKDGMYQIPLDEELVDYMKENKHEYPYDIYEEDEIPIEESKMFKVTEKEIENIKEFVLEEELFVQQLFDVVKKPVLAHAVKKEFEFDKVEQTFEKIKQVVSLHEDDHRILSNLLRYRLWSLDNFKRIFKTSHVKRDSIFDDEWEEEDDVKEHFREMTHEERMQYRKEHPRQYTFLIVEDSTFMWEITQSMLQQNFDCYVDVQKNGLDGFHAYKEKAEKNEPYDLVIMDIVMPVMNGIESLEKIIQIDKGAKVVMSSSLVSKKIVEESVQKGAKHFVRKPYEDEHVASVIRSVLNEN